MRKNVLSWYDLIALFFAIGLLLYVINGKNLYTLIADFGTFWNSNPFPYSMSDLLTDFQDMSTAWSTFGDLTSFANFVTALLSTGAIIILPFRYVFYIYVWLFNIVGYFLW